MHVGSRGLTLSSSSIPPTCPLSSSLPWFPTSTSFAALVQEVQWCFPSPTSWKVEGVGTLTKSTIDPLWRSCVLNHSFHEFGRHCCQSVPHLLLLHVYVDSMRPVLQDVD